VDDERFEYEALRTIALAPGTGVFYYVAFVERAETRRTISLGRAKWREVRLYVECA
jgi:uncharacterized protein